MRIAIIVLAASIAASVAGAAPAVAQEGAPYIKLDCPDLGDQTPKVASRDACHQIANRDKKTFARLKNVVRADIHGEDGKLMARNYKHVVMAYAALWILAVVFLLLLFLRQRAMGAKIVHLERELAIAVGSSGGDSGRKEEE
jgi:hypothetical protein